MSAEPDGSQGSTPSIPYEPIPGRFDEAFVSAGRPHPHTRGMVESLNRLGEERLGASAERRDAIFMQRGITFDATGPDGQTRDRPFPLDLIPRIISAAEWDFISNGVQQPLSMRACKFSSAAFTITLPFPGTVRSNW